MSGLLDALARWAEQAVQTGGSFALALVMLTENLFPPIPSEAVLPLAGFLVSRGTIGLVPALGAATAGSVVGALILYSLGRWGGRPLLYRYRRILRLDERQLDRADAWFDHYGGKIVFWCRMIPLVRSVVSVPAGASEMPIVRFTLLTAAGSLVWNSLLLVAGLLLGDHWERVSDLAAAYSDVVLICLALATVVAVGVGVWLARQNRRARTRDEDRSA